MYDTTMILPNKNDMYIQFCFNVGPASKSMT